MKKDKKRNQNRMAIMFYWFEKQPAGRGPRQISNSKLKNKRKKTRSRWVGYSTGGDGSQKTYHAEYHQALLEYRN